MHQRRSPVEAQCPVRPGEPCSLCTPGATGPHDCGLVYLVMRDADLRDELARLRAQHRAELPAQRRAEAS
jgi:hypothetical protein